MCHLVYNHGWETNKIIIINRMLQCCIMAPGSCRIFGVFLENSGDFHIMSETYVEKYHYRDIGLFHINGDALHMH